MSNGVGNAAIIKSNLLPITMLTITATRQITDRTKITIEKVRKLSDNGFPKGFSDFLRRGVPNTPECDPLQEPLSVIEEIRSAVDEMPDFAPSTLEDDPAFMRTLGVLELQSKAMEEQARSFREYSEDARVSAKAAWRFSAASLVVSALSLLIAAISLLGQFGVIRLFS